MLDRFENRTDNNEFRDGMPLGLMLNMVSHCHDNIIKSELDAIGAQKAFGGVLMHIARYDGINQSDLAKHMNYSAPTISVTVQKLEEGGFIKRIPDEYDQRQFSITLTDKGKEMAEKIHQTFVRCENVLAKDFTPDQLETLREFLKKMYSNISEEKKTL